MSIQQGRFPQGSGPFRAFSPSGVCVCAYMHASGGGVCVCAHLGCVGVMIFQALRTQQATKETTLPLGILESVRKKQAKTKQL